MFHLNNYIKNYYITKLKLISIILFIVLLDLNNSKSILFMNHNIKFLKDLFIKTKQKFFNILYNINLYFHHYF